MHGCMSSMTNRIIPRQCLGSFLTPWMSYATRRGYSRGSSIDIVYEVRLVRLLDVSALIHTELIVASHIMTNAHYHMHILVSTSLSRFVTMHVENRLTQWIPFPSVSLRILERTVYTNNFRRCHHGRVQNLSAHSAWYPSVLPVGESRVSSTRYSARSTVHVWSSIAVLSIVSTSNSYPIVRTQSAEGKCGYLAWGLCSPTYGLLGLWKMHLPHAKLDRLTSRNATQSHS